MYDYKKSKEIIESILKSPTKIVEKDFVPSSDSAFTYENGITAWVGALFVDIVDSSKIFQSPNEDIARIMISMSRGISVSAPSFAASRSDAGALETLSSERSPVRTAESSCRVSTAASSEKPSMMEIPPPAPCLVRSGMPALQMSSISRLMVRRDTPNFSARYGAVTVPFC